MGRKKDSGSSGRRGCFSRICKWIAAAGNALFERGSQHPLRWGVGVGLALMIILLGAGLLMASKLAVCRSDWFSFWTGWIPGVCSAGLGFSSIFITVCVAKGQTRQNALLNDMQTRLTLAANLPALRVSGVEFYSRAECAEANNGLDGLDMADGMLFRFKIVFSAESLPANYQAVLEDVLWRFPALSGTEWQTAPEGRLGPGHFTARILRSSQEAVLLLDFLCRDPAKKLFTRFYMYPDYQGRGEDRVELTLRLRMNDLLLNAVMENARLAAGPKPGDEKYDGRLDLHLSLVCQRRYNEGDPPNSPVIFVADHSISAPRRGA